MGQDKAVLTAQLVTVIVDPAREEEVIPPTMVIAIIRPRVWSIPPFLPVRPGIARAKANAYPAAAFSALAAARFALRMKTLSSSGRSAPSRNIASAAQITSC
jgi:hypothetical protein